MLRIWMTRALAFVSVIACLTLSDLGRISLEAKALPSEAASSARNDRQVNEELLKITAKKSLRRVSRLAPPLPQKHPFKQHNVTLAAALAENAPPLSEGLSWRILRLDQGKKEPELIWSGGGSGPELTLKPGRYYAEAAYGLVKNGSEFEVVAHKPISHLIALNAGTLRVHGAAVSGGPPLDDMFFTLRKADPQAGEDERDVGRSSLSQALFHVQAGDYELVAHHGLAKIQMPLTVKAGETKVVEAVMNSAKLTLSARAKADSAPISGSTFFIYENGEAGRNREIARSKLDEPSFSLPAGHYRIAAVLGLAQVEQDITVKPGEEAAKSLVLNAGGVRLSSQLSGNGDPLDHHLLYRVFNLSGKNGTPANKEILTSTLPSPTIFLSEGRYRIESQYGWHNARQTREIEIKPGDVVNVGFEHKACEIQLKLVPRPGGKAIERVKWTLKYNGGGTVLISQDAVPALILQAGNYQAVAQYQTKTYTQTFEAVSNREQIVEVVIQ